jgi:cholinesterase
MRTKSYKEILDGMRKAGNTGSGASGFRPTADNKVVFRDYPERLAAGNFIKAPMLVGNNDDEAGLTAALAKIPRPQSSGGPKMLKRQAAAANPQQCGAHNTAAGRVKLSVPAWRYIFNGVYPNSVGTTSQGRSALADFDQDIGSKGAYHTAEIAMVFGTTEYLSHKVCERSRDPSEANVTEA